MSTPAAADGELTVPLRAMEGMEGKAPAEPCGGSGGGGWRRAVVMISESCSMNHKTSCRTRVQQKQQGPATGRPAHRH